MSQEINNQPKETTIPESPNSELPKHSVIDDVQGIIIGSLMAAFGIAIFTHMNFLIGGTAS